MHSLEGRLKSPSLSRYRLLFSISPSPLLPLPLCGGKKSWSPPSPVSMRANYFSLSSRVLQSVCVCVRTCVPACGYCISTDQVELGAETFHGREKKESGKGSREGQKWKERHIITHILMTPVVSNMGQLTKNKEAIGFQHGNERPIWAKMVENTF